jgi:transposase
MTTGIPVESPARWKPHTGFGGRLAETEQLKGCHRAAGRPYWAVLEDAFECLLVNARHVKAVPGRKTDVKDAEWLCQLAEAGLLRASFVPPKPIRALRNLTRYRKTQPGSTA